MENLAKRQTNCNKIKLCIFLCQNVFSIPYQKSRSI